ncbi:MAG: transcription regulator, LytR family [Actinomycetia bacterium]|nr:transcription regulator, LytR family [Actinomycetes bacterium]
MLRLPGGKALAGKTAYAVSCVTASLVLAVAGVGYYAQRQADSFGQSGVLAGGPSTGSMNILVMGLESRTYWSGKPLPRYLEDIMHIGDSGGDATNTLILIHIFAGGQKAVGFSIPRDDYVQMAGTMGYDGITTSKIDNAYGYAMAAKMSQLAQTNPSMASWEQNYQGNEAGRQAAVDTVEKLTGQQINHFAELNLDGFYQLAQEFGGIEVCVKPYDGGTNLTDANSGANLKVGYQHLDAAQALSFVRERDNLPEGDLDRTARQQAVLDYVLWKFKIDGMFEGIARLGSLLSFASNYLITSKGWNLLQFAGEMDALDGQNLTFHTLPITGNATVPAIGDVNTVDVPAIQAQVAAAFAKPPGGAATGGTGTAAAGKGGSNSSSANKAPAKKAVPPASSVTVDVYNGGAPGGSAGAVSSALQAKGYVPGAVANAASPQSLTTVSYGGGTSANAALIARGLGVHAIASNAVPAGHVRVILGGSYASRPAALGGSPSAAGSSSAQRTGAASSSASPSYTTTNGASVTVKPNAKYGIPCVY